MKFLATFRARLLLILSLLLIATLSVQYYLNIQTQNENSRIIEAQEQAFLAGIALGFNSMTSEDRLRDFVKREGQPFYDRRTTERIKDILVINSDWQVNDSLSDDYLPSVGEDGQTKYLKLKDIKNLPPLMEGADAYLVFFSVSYAPSRRTFFWFNASNVICNVPNLEKC